MHNIYTMARVNYRFDQNRDNQLNRKDFKYEMPIFKAGGTTWINYKGYFSLEHLYKRVYEYLSAEIGYKGPFGTDMFEPYFYEERGADGSVKEIWYWWRAFKNAPDGNKMFRYRIFIDFQILGLKSETVVIDGQKIKQNYGELSVFVKPFLDFDLKGKKGDSMVGGKSWHEDSLTKSFAKWFEKRAYSGQLDQRKAEMYGHANGVVGCIKNHLQLAGFQGFRMDFHPQKGHPQNKL